MPHPRCSYVLSRVGFLSVGGGWVMCWCCQPDRTGRGRSWWRAGSYEVTVLAGQAGVPGGPADRGQASGGAAVVSRARPPREAGGSGGGAEVVVDLAGNVAFQAAD